MKAYPAYKPAGVPWLPQMPEHWSFLRTKHFLREVNVRSKTGKEDLLSVSQYTGITKRKDSLRGGSGLLTNAKTLVGYKLVEPGDLVMNIMLAWRGSQAVSSHRGITSPAYSVFRVTRDDVVPEYLHYIYRTELYNGLFKTVSTGVMDSRLRLYPEVFFRLPTLLPPKEEQHLIVRYLRALDAKVKRYIRTKRKLIAALQEQKQAIIQRAVTRGLNPNVKLKPSGVEWLGEVPEHWEVVRSRRLFSQRREKARAGDEQLTAAQSYGVIPQKLFMELEGRRVTQVVLNKEILKHVEVNDFVISMRSFQGGLELCSHSGCISSAYVPITPRAEVFPGFFKYLLKAPAYIKALASTSDLVRDGQAMRMENFAAIDLVLVPLDEQKRIAAYLDDQLRSLENAISRVQKEIILIQEYHTRNIADVVTGAVDVREAAGKLPEEDQMIGRSDDQMMEEEAVEPELNEQEE